jgi:plastocyanin
MNTVYAVQDLSHPESPAPFIATAIVIGSGIITVVLAVLAARGRPARARRVWTAGLAGLGVLVVGSLVAAGAVDDVTVQPGDTVVAAQDYEFPERVEIDPTSDAIVIDNEDRGRHTFVVDDRIARVEVPASSRVRVDIGSLEAGSYRYYCDVPGHEAMEGTIVVG